MSTYWNIHRASGYIQISGEWGAFLHYGCFLYIKDETALDAGDVNGLYEHYNTADRVS